MNLPLNKPSHRGGGNAGAVVLGGTGAAPAQLCVGAVGFGPQWEDQPTLRELYDQACASIVRAECEIEELRAEVTLLREERGILQQQLRAAEALGLALVERMKEGK
jgi:hypothetical protein